MEMRIDDLASFGFTIVQSRMGLRWQSLFDRIFKRKEVPISSRKTLMALGNAVGLNASEVDGAVEQSSSQYYIPHWLTCFLVIIAIFAGFSIIYMSAYAYYKYYTYTPGTFYSSIHPNDFKQTTRFVTFFF